MKLIAAGIFIFSVSFATCDFAQAGGTFQQSSGFGSNNNTNNINTNNNTNNNNNNNQATSNGNTNAGNGSNVPAVSMTPADYLSKMSSLSSSDLVEHFSKSPTFGDCSFRKSAAASATCKYIITLASGEKYCLTNQLRESSKYLIGLHAPASAQGTYSNQQQYFEELRGDYNNITNIDNLAAEIVRTEFLDSNNLCNVGSGDIPTIRSSDLDQFQSSDVNFYKDTQTKRLYCSVSSLSYRVWDYDICKYKEYNRFLPTKVCKVMYNRFKKQADFDGSLTPIFGNLSLSTSEQMIKQKLIEKNPEISIAVSNIPIEEAIPAETLQAIECRDFSGLPDFVNGDCSSQMNFYKNLQTTITAYSNQFDTPTIAVCPASTCTKPGASNVNQDVSLSYDKKRLMYEQMAKDTGGKLQTDVTLTISSGACSQNDFKNTNLSI